MQLPTFVYAIIQSFESHSNPNIAAQQQAYMRDRFLFLGLKSPLRKNLQKPVFQQNRSMDIADLPQIVPSFWQLDAREYQYTAMEWAASFKNNYRKEDIYWMEKCICQKSWWDSVDFIATNLVGNYFRLYPEQILPYAQKWIDSNHLWLQRTALLFPLKYKNELDTKLLQYVIESCISHQDFFIRKAIGWILREYSKTNAVWVKTFVDQHPKLSPLSKKEALKWLQKKGI
ncbi:MAG: DNA alkylation repair protein [Flavobacteriaceae bacterium]|nr:DNA alkylation repair protein [Flavobacteriaceae bacterium]